ncbi:UPF0489 protein C5orf22 homolog [Drosophila mojavensis]|uniref:Misexpression suppressor of ras 6 n=1 Tax=Drosophila mojavensis TaxID=7230 RepID=B4KZ98_DROMO|nr:UPF0489 protein C5orf22 homolog [Drosophila mojavensis]EDW18924.1 uncharacterized protein Dmoj_GI13498 [Drosophila mojavensis]
MESDTTEIESTAAAAAELQTPLQSESVVGGKGEDKVEGDATPPPHKRQKTEKDDDADADEPKEKQIEESEEQVPQLVAVERSQISLRQFNRIPVFIVDYHNDVLEFIYRCLASRHLPLERNVLVHFDSHPDLVVDRDIPASASYDKDVMLNELSIENWIMPTLYAGHFNRVVWLKNSWCQQIPTGKHQFKIGHKEDRIGVDCPLDYFISEGNYCTSDELQEARSVELQVHDADSEALDPAEFLSEKDAGAFILDIDLDFFSTSNPFLEIYKDANCYEQLTEIFHFESVEPAKRAGTATIADFCATAETRQKQLDALKRIFWHLEEERTFDGLERPDESVITPQVYAKILHLAEQLQAKYPDDEIDWLLIFDSGSTTDNNGLPHHISTTKELEDYFAHFKRFLQRLPVPPVAITMAHSARDDYCPQDQVAFIEEQVLRLLREVFGDKLHEKAILHYMDDPWDVMKL